MNVTKFFKSLFLITLSYSPAAAEEGVSSTQSEIQSAYADDDRGIERNAETENKISVSYRNSVGKHKHSTISAEFDRTIINNKKFEHLILHHKVNKFSANTENSSEIDLHYGVGVFKKTHFLLAGKYSEHSSNSRPHSNKKIFGAGLGKVLKKNDFLKVSSMFTIGKHIENHQNGTKSKFESGNLTVIYSHKLSPTFKLGSKLHYAKSFTNNSTIWNGNVGLDVKISKDFSISNKYTVTHRSDTLNGLIPGTEETFNIGLRYHW
jgi:putative salt-induced outer membrane protein YdiY